MKIRRPGLGPDFKMNTKNEFEILPESGKISMKFDTPELLYHGEAMKINVELTNNSKEEVKRIVLATSHPYLMGFELYEVSEVI